MALDLLPLIDSRASPACDRKAELRKEYQSCKMIAIKRREILQEPLKERMPFTRLSAAPSCGSLIELHEILSIIARGLQAWIWLTWQSRRFRKLGGRFCKYLFNQNVPKAFNHWLRVLLERRRIRTFIERWRLAEVVRALELWYEAKLQWRRQRNFVLRLKNRGISRALERWFEFGDEWRRMRNVRYGGGITCTQLYSKSSTDLSHLARVCR